MNTTSRWAVMLWLLPIAACPNAAPAFAAEAGSQATPGYFRVEKAAGRWWLVDPTGERFISKGVCHIQFAADPIKATRRSLYGEATKAKYGTIEKWRAAAARRLLGWGFNTLGAWSDPALGRVEVEGRRLADAAILDLGSGFVAADGQGEGAWLRGLFPDVFEPGFETFCRERTKQRCQPRKGDRWLLGWFTDNEMRWGPDWRGQDELLTMFLNLPVGKAGRVAAFRLLRERHGTIDRFNAVWKTSFASWGEAEQAPSVAAPLKRKELYAQNEGDERKANEAQAGRAAFVGDCEAFVGLLAERYFRITSEAIREADPHHLNFGCRFAYAPPAAVLAAAARYPDVISFNCYATDPKGVVLTYAGLGKPLLIGEFTFRAQDVGLPNTKGAGPRVATQTDRAAGFERYVRTILAQPEIVGYHWFQHSDQPAEGRFDGENSNYGVVDARDQPYDELAAKMTEVNRLAEQWHRGGE
jgi:agarase